MNVLTVSDRIVLGKQTENGICVLQFPIDDWIELYGSGGTFHLFNKRPTETNAYPVVITNDDKFVYWIPKSADLLYSGMGECQLDYTFLTAEDPDYQKVLRIYPTRIDRSLTTDGTVPEPYEDWVTQVEGYADRAESAADSAEESAEQASASATSAVETKFSTFTATATTLSAGASATATYDLANNVLNLGIPRGDKGSKGDTGERGETGAKGDPGTTDWNGLTNKPSTFPPSAHTHDDRYHTKAEIDTALSGKVDAVQGKGLSTNDYTDTDKSKVSEAFDAKHTHDNKSVLDNITSLLVSAWNDAVTWITTYGTSIINHMSNTVAHITGAERTKWNGYESTITTQSTEIANLTSGKVDKVQGKGLSTNDYDNTEKSKVTSAYNATSGELVFIESIPRGSHTEISRTAEPDSTPYNFKEIVVRISAGTVQGSAWSFIFCFGQSGRIASRYSPWLQSDTNSEIRVFPKSGRWELECGNWQGEYPKLSDNGLRSDYFSDNGKLSVNPTIKRVWLQNPGDVADFSAVDVEIWAIRA